MVQTVTNLTKFSFESKEIRTVTQNNETWFCAKDILDALNYGTSNITERIVHVPKEWKGSISTATLTGNQDLLFLSEQGLNFFVIRSNKPKALPFQKWLASEVLPSIRKTGTYLHPAAAEVLYRHGLKDIFDCDSPEQLEEKIIRYKEKKLVNTTIPEMNDAERNMIISEFLSGIASKLIPSIVECCTKEILHNTTKYNGSQIQPLITPEPKNSESELHQAIAVLQKEINQLKSEKKSKYIPDKIRLEKIKNEIISSSENKRKSYALPSHIRFYYHDSKRASLFREYLEVKTGQNVKIIDFYDQVFDIFQENILKT